MSYKNGTFYTIDGIHYIDGVTIINSTVNGVLMLSGTTVPTTLSAPTGSIYVLKSDNASSLYQNKGTSAAPDWYQLDERDTGNDFLSFTLPNQVGPSVISTTNATIAITLPYGSSRDALIATFTTSPDATVKIGDVAQTSGVSINNFDTPKYYTVTSQTGVAKQWTITVSVALNTETDILVYGIPGSTTVRDVENHTILARLPSGSTIGTYAPTFTLSDGAIALINNVQQESGVTEVDFSEATGENPQSYNIVSEDSEHSQYWTVTVEVIE